MHFVSVVGARPQFIKAAPLSLELRKHHREVLVHTGQHYDQRMSELFFDELGIPAPDYHLGVGSGSHGAQTGDMLKAIELVLQQERPDAVIVYGDTNSTLAAALAAVKLHIPVAHVEAGLRSFNRMMPEEINRIVTDHVSTWLFVPSEPSQLQLAHEGITEGVHVVGDIMFDALLLFNERARQYSRVLERLELVAGDYYVATVHRAENTDHAEQLGAIFRAFDRLNRPVVVPVHPRTRIRLDEFGIKPTANVRLVEPQGYLDMLRLQEQSRCVLTDSGGVQKEAYYLGVPCVTMRNETEWVETIETGWNRLVGTDVERIVAAAHLAPDGASRRPTLYGDGAAAEKMVRILAGPGPIARFELARKTRASVVSEPPCAG